MERLLANLDDSLPTDDATTIVHGDYRLDNTIVTLEPRSRIRAVLDWEFSTLGDPIADLGLMLTYWHDPGDEGRSEISVAAGITDHLGFLTVDDLAQRYASRSGRDLRSLRFHRALAAMKLAVILEGVHARYLNGQTVSAGYEAVGASVPALVAQGLALVGQPE
jgi:aminoglycoside phosphotransferase (APT) family kinase protein